jgi:hypothetical protein
MVYRYVNTDSTAGGNGTTNETAGDNRAWATMAEAELALRNGSISDDLKVLFCGSAIDSNSSQVSWLQNTYTYVTGAKNIFLYANSKDPKGYHGGVWKNDRYIFQSTTSTDPAVLFKAGGGSDIYINGLQFLMSNTGSGVSLYVDGSGASNYASMNRCLIKRTTTGTGSTVMSNGYEGGVSFYNTIAVGTGYGFGFAQERWTSYANCLAYNFNRGIGSAGYQPQVYNCVSFNNVQEDIYNASTIDYCATDDGMGTHPVVVSNWSDQFSNPNYATDMDFRLKPTSILIKACPAYVGASMGSALRSGLTEIGPFAYTFFKQRYPVVFSSQGK